MEAAPGTVEHMTDVVLFDTATVRFRYTQKRSALEVRAGTGELLAVVDTLPDIEDAHNAQRGFEHALASAYVRRPKLTRIGLYHPWTTQVSVGSQPTTIYGDNQPLTVPLEGLLVTQTAEGVYVEDRLLRRIEPSFSSAMRTWVAASR